MITQDQIDKILAAAPAGPSGISGPEPRIRDIRKLVRLIPNDPSVGRDAWVTRAFQIKALALDEAEGGAAYDEWSQKHASYDAAETARVWDSIHTIRISGLGLLADAEAADHAGFTDVMNGEARAAFDDGVVHPVPPPAGGGGGYKPTHVACAEAVISAGRGRLGWLSTASHRWAAYDEVFGRWEVGDDDSEMRTAVRLEAERRRGMGVDAKTGHEMGRSGWRLAVQSLLVRERRLRIVTGRFNADLDVAGVPGGVLRLDRAMGVRREEKGKPDHMVSKALAVRPGPSMCPVWLGFLDEFTMRDKSLALWWQAFCGYCLTGWTTEQIVVFLYGTGGNGKSVFLDIIGEVMGDYHVRADHRLFMAKVGGFHLAPLAALEGARLVTCPDVGVNAVWDVGLVKAISGGGLITANRMRENSFSFEPQCKVVLAGNEKPRLDNVDAGVKRRFTLVPALGVPVRVDKGLMEKLRREREGILEWMLRGWEMWALGGLPKCAAIEKETESYLEGADVFGRWMKDTLAVSAGDRTRHRITDLWRAWDAFRMSEGGGHSAPNDVTRLTTKLKEAGFGVYRDNKGSYVDGITVTKTSVF